MQLQSEAIYRVCQCDRDLIAVEVVRAPGLRAGEKFRFTRDAVAAMELIDSPNG